MHIDYLNLESNQEKIELYLNSSGENGKGSTFTLLIGENGVHKTTLLGYIYKIFSGKFLNRDTKMKIIYTIENKTYKVDTFYKHDSDHNVIVDSFSRIDKMDKTYLDWRRYGKERVNDTLIREFINTMVIASINNHRKYKEITDLFDYIGINSNDLILSYRNRKRKPDDMYLRYLSDENFVSKLNDLFDDLLNYPSFQDIYNFDNHRISLFTENADDSKIIALKKIKAIEQYSLYLFEKAGLVSYSKNGYTFISLSRFVESKKKLEIFKKIIIFFNENLKSYFFNNLYIDNENFPLIELSTGEISLLLRLFNIINQIENNSIILIDEPELHLHPNWCINYISKLKQLFNKYDSHFIIATHSPLLVSNLNKEDLVVLKKEKNVIRNSNIDTGTLGVDIDTVLEQVFGVTLRDSEIISTIFQDIQKKFNSKSRDKHHEAVNELKKLPQSSEKFRVFKKYYEKIKELDNGL
ncbi:AAA family ATPase [Streptococcus sp. SM3]|jgi:hypothetical protein|uniref:AAA family ATPase n=1 Tax=Streptococcus sp. SM3 TaxID=2898231 RepID=UPI0022B7ABDB|nr:AAA family ATPase [Streptococcus sp. SM3]